MSDVLRVPISLAPVLCLLSLLVVLDSYQLVPFRSVLRAVGAGIAAAGVCLVVNVRLIEWLDLDVRTFARSVAPVIEELIKAAYVMWLVRTHRVGFTVDAAILGFAVGAGFALVENIYYLMALEDPGVLVWGVRGLGTATLHGSTTAIVAIVSKSLADRRGTAAVTPYLAGLGIAVSIHLAFNQFVLPPVLATAIILAVLPPVVVFVFGRSERATRHWLGSGFDADMEILERIGSGEFQDSRIGRYLESLRDRFPPVVVGDMLCLLQVHHELAIRAKATLLARQSGLEIPLGEDVRANLKELDYLERSVGKTGRLALAPLLGSGSRDVWQLRVLGR